MEMYKSELSVQNLPTFINRFISIGTVLLLLLLSGCGATTEEPVNEAGITDTGNGTGETGNGTGSGSGTGGNVTGLSVTSTDPDSEAIGVPLNSNIVITMNMDLLSSVDASTVYLQNQSGQSISSDVTFDSGTMSITINPVTALDATTTYTLTITTVVEGIDGTSLANNYTSSFTTVTGDLPPDFALWESNMLTWGAHWGEYQNPNGGNGWSTRFNNAYYDILWNMYQIKEYTGQSEPWDTYIQYAKSSYRNEYYRANDYNVPGYQRFSHGLLADYLAGGDTTIQDIRDIRDKPAFSNLSEFQGSYTGESQNVSREMSYVLQAHVNAEKAGEPRNVAKVSQFVAWMANHMREWRTDTFSADEFFQPFMFALTAHSLIEFYEWEVQNGRDPNAYWPTTYWPTITDALAEFSSWMYNDSVVRYGRYAGQRMWVADVSGPGMGGFRYADREYEEGAGAIYPGLNLLTAPVYMWVYKQTGDVSFRNMADIIFVGGVSEGNADASGKEFDQNYRWSFKYVQWRSEADLLW